MQITIFFLSIGNIEKNLSIFTYNYKKIADIKFR